MPAPLLKLPPIRRRHAGLVQPLPGGGLDLVGDVHGQLPALADLLCSLGYDTDGNHPQDRRLVFLGDLVDRGPQSVQVVKWVMRLVNTGKADCILGNHELNILRGKVKLDNAWFFGDPLQGGAGGLAKPQREEILAFFKSLPVAMERDDLRAVHACWFDPAIDLLRNSDDALKAHNDYGERIVAELDRSGITDALERELAIQNRNPVRTVTSGPECRADAPFVANGQARQCARVTWWDRYREKAFCVFGHYWRNAPAGVSHGPDIFAGYDAHHTLGPGSAICIDYSVGARGRAAGVTRLAALRWPQRELMFDDGTRRAIETR